MAQGHRGTGRVHEIALLHLAGDEEVGQEIVAAAAERRLDEGRRKSATESGRVDARELSLGRERVVAEAEIVDVGIEPQRLAAAPEVAVGVVGTHARSIDGGVARRDADQVALALAHLDEERQVALRVETFPFPHPHGAEALDAGHRAADVRNGLRRVGIARLRIDEGADHRRVDAVGGLDRHLPHRGFRSRIDGEAHVHDVGGIVHHGIARHGLGEGVAERPEAIDDPGLAGEHRRRAGGHVVAGAGEALGQNLFREGAAARIQGAHRAQGVGGAEIDRDLHRNERAGAGALRRAGRGGKRGFPGHGHAVDANRDGTLIIAVAREHVSEAAQVGLGAAHQPLAIRRRFLAQAVERRGVLQRLEDIRIVGAGDAQAVGQSLGTRGGRRLVAAEQAEQVESLRGLRQGRKGQDTQENATDSRRTQQAVHPDKHAMGEVLDPFPGSALRKASKC